MNNLMIKKCLWCLKQSPAVTFDNKAHTIPKSLGGLSLNPNVCDGCNSYFGNRNSNNSTYSIEEALKEAFNISRRRMLESGETKRKIGRFKSKFFEIKERNGKYRVVIKPSFRFTKGFQEDLSHAFKRGLYKMFLEELNRQKNVGYENQFDVIRDFARHNKGDLPVFYFNRVIGMIIMLKHEAETPILFFDRMKYLYSNDKFVEIEFLGHVLGFPISTFEKSDFDKYISESFKVKDSFFINAVQVKRLTDIDLALTIFNK